MFVPENGQSWQRVGCLLFRCRARLRSRAHGFHYTIEKRCGEHNHTNSTSHNLDNVWKAICASFCRRKKLHLRNDLHDMQENISIQGKYTKELQKDAYCLNMKTNLFINFFKNTFHLNMYHNQLMIFEYRCYHWCLLNRARPGSIQIHPLSWRGCNNLFRNPGGTRFQKCCWPECKRH